MSASGARADQQEWFHGIDLFSRLSGPIADLTRIQQSLLFAELSQIAYMPPEPATDCVRKIGFLEAVYLDHDGAQAFRFRNERDCVIVCRGTEPNEWNDVKADANAIAVLAETVGRVHSGFKREVDDLWPDIERHLADNALPRVVCRPFAGRRHGDHLCRTVQDLQDPFQPDGALHLRESAGR